MRLYALNSQVIPKCRAKSETDPNDSHSECPITLVVGVWAVAMAHRALKDTTYILCSALRTSSFPKVSGSSVNWKRVRAKDK